MASLKPTKLTAMYYQHLEMGARMVDDDGWQLPGYYTSKEDELAKIKESGGICDVSSNGKLMLYGEDLDALLASAFSAVGPLEVGRNAHCNALDEGGGGIDQVLLCRLSQDEVYVITAPDKVRSIVCSLEPRLNGCAHLVDVSSGFAAVKVVGPLSRQMLSKLTELNLNPKRFPNLSCAQTKLAELYTLVLRHDEAAQDSYEVHVERSYGEFVWDAMLEAGDELNVRPIGIEALNLLRSEAQ